MKQGNIIFIHLNNSIAPYSTSSYTYNTIPDYFLHVLKYTKKFNYNIHFLGHSQDIDKIDESIQCFDIQKYSNYIQEITDKLKTNFPEQIKDDFWFLTTIRLFLVNRYIHENKLDNTIHLEGDNIIFYDYDPKIFETLNSGEFSYGKVGPYLSGPGIILYKDFKSAENFNNIIYQIYSNSANKIRPHTGFYGHISEMSVIDIITRKSKKYKELPTLNGDGYIYDPASYGQYLYGTNNGHLSGFTDNLHYIGQSIKQKDIDVIMEKNKPLIIKDGNKQKIFNLHIHNKPQVFNFK